MLGNLIFEVRFFIMFFEDFWKKLLFDEILFEKEKIYIFIVIVGKIVEDVFFKFIDCIDCKWYV